MDDGMTDVVLLSAIVAAILGVLLGATVALSLNARREGKCSPSRGNSRGWVY
jgi:hypothetical protein